MSENEEVTRAINPVIMLIIKSVAAAVTFAATLMTVWTLGPWAETRFAPAVSKLQIDSLVEVEGGVQIMVRFNKLRNCEYLGIAWFMGNRATSFERVSVELRRRQGDTSSPNRPMGEQRSGPWIIAMGEQQFRQNSFAVLYHRCHPFWVTTTEFYP